jgi:hypothetical protein
VTRETLKVRGTTAPLAVPSSGGAGFARGSV